MITPQSIQNVMQRADLLEVAEQFIKLKKRGTNYIGNCPFHNEKTPSFVLSPAKGIYKCFGCGKGGNVVTFLQEHEKYSYPEAIKWLAQFYHISIEETHSVNPERIEAFKKEEALRILNEAAAKWFHETLKNTEQGQMVGLSYLKS
jgi:DNA primase